MVSWRTFGGVLLSGAIAAAGTFASTVVVGGLYLLYSRGAPFAPFPKASSSRRQGDESVVDLATVRDRSL